MRGDEMFKGFAYATACHDGKGGAVKREDAWLDDLDEVYLPLSDFLGWQAADSVLEDSIDKLYVGHYAPDAEEPELTWEVRAYPLLTILSH